MGLLIYEYKPLINRGPLRSCCLTTIKFYETGQPPQHQSTMAFTPRQNKPQLLLLACGTCGKLFRFGDIKVIPSVNGVTPNEYVCGGCTERTDRSPAAKKDVIALKTIEICPRVLGALARNYGDERAALNRVGYILGETQGLIEKRMMKGASPRRERPSPPRNPVNHVMKDGPDAGMQIALSPIARKRTRAEQTPSFSKAEEKEAGYVAPPVPMGGRKPPTTDNNLKALLNATANATDKGKHNEQIGTTKQKDPAADNSGDDDHDGLDLSRPPWEQKG